MFVIVLKFPAVRYRPFKIRLKRGYCFRGFLTYIMDDSLIRCWTLNVRCSMFVFYFILRDYTYGLKAFIYHLRHGLPG